jgi:hypothetical protein
MLNEAGEYNYGQIRDKRFPFPHQTDKRKLFVHVWKGRFTEGKRNKKERKKERERERDTD